MVMITKNFSMQAAIRNLAVDDREQFIAAGRFSDPSLIMTLNLISKPCQQTRDETHRIDDLTRQNI